MIRDSCRLCGKRFEPRHAEPLLEFVRPYYPEFQQKTIELLGSSFSFLCTNIAYISCIRFDSIRSYRTKGERREGGGRGEARGTERYHTQSNIYATAKEFPPKFYRESTSRPGCCELSILYGKNICSTLHRVHNHDTTIVIVNSLGPPQ